MLNLSSSNFWTLLFVVDTQCHTHAHCVVTAIADHVQNYITLLIHIVVLMLIVLSQL